jgi:hypothetical protein
MTASLYTALYAATADVDLAEGSSWLQGRNMTMNSHAWMDQTAVTSRGAEELRSEQVID